MNLQSRKNALRYFFTKVVEPMGFKFTPDADLVEFVLEQEVALQSKHGSPFCPCQPLRNERARDMQMICPCIAFHRRQFDLMKRCWCGLFVHQGVVDPALLPQSLPREVGLE